VKPEADPFLVKAHKLLDEADGMLAMKCYEIIPSTQVCGDRGMLPSSRHIFRAKRA
jgi:hypothetical protein